VSKLSVIPSKQSLSSDASEEKIASVMHVFVEAVVKKDIEKALSCFEDDSVCEVTEGRFKGKSEIRRYLTWFANSKITNFNVAEAGIGLLIKGNTAVYESDQEGTYEGARCKTRTISIYEFKGEKIQRVREVWDRLSLAKQAARGWFARRAVNAIVNAMEKGLQ
jgi:ketosteroid isomerase-like protein